jgi:hypothetical protein
MKTKTHKFKHNKKQFSVTIPLFDSLKEAVAIVGEAEVFRVYLYGQLQVAKLLETGRDPFKVKQKRIIIRTKDLTEEQIQQLQRIGLIQTE